MSIKGLELKGGKIVIQEKEKDLRIRKNYSLPQQTITDIEELAKECSKKLEEEAKKLQEGSKEKKQIETMIINLNNNITSFEDKSQE